MRTGYIKDKSYRSLFLKKEEKLRSLSCVGKNFFLPISWRTGAKMLNQNLGAFKVRITNFCIYSYRSRGVLRSFKMSRHIFKDLVPKGEVAGYRKSSW